LIGNALEENGAIRRNGPRAIIVLNVDSDVEPSGIMPRFKLKFVGLNYF